MGKCHIKIRLTPVFSKYGNHKREFSELANDANNSFEIREIRPFAKFAFQARHKRYYSSSYFEKAISADPGFSNAILFYDVWMECKVPTLTYRMDKNHEAIQVGRVCNPLFYTPQGASG